MESGRNNNSCSVEVDGDDQYDDEGQIHVEQDVETPKIDMKFDAVEQVFEYYRKYGEKNGFGVTKRSTKKFKGLVRYFIVTCHKYGKPRSQSKNTIRPHPVIKSGCKARLCAKLVEDGKWVISALELNHNHPISPSKSRYYRSHRQVTTRIKRALEFGRMAGLSTSKNINCVAAQFGEKQMPCLRKDCENYLGELRKLSLVDGDANALQSYFTEMQTSDPNFFYVLDHDEESRIRNVFWADARSRAAYEEFGDVISFDTTYLTNKYDLPFAPFVGVNHHGQSILLGCGLISSETTEGFVWLFNSWLRCMSRAPQCIITDQARAIQNAIEVVFPDAHHRWCLWHIMMKVPDKFKGYEEYESIKFCLHNVVYDSLMVDEFENGWNAMIEKYELSDNDWLEDLYVDRKRWVPCFVKDYFWAGMSTTQRSEGMNAFFDGYVNAKTSLREFVGQYANALKSKVEKELEADCHSLSSYIPCATPHAMEKQIQEVYTNSKFLEFQKEVRELVLCESKLFESRGSIYFYNVKELHYGENQTSPKVLTMKVSFIHEEGEGQFDVKCSCKLFEFRGILCKHILKVLLFERSIYAIPSKYILRRWRKDIKRRHTKIKVSYNTWNETEEGRRYDDMHDTYYEVADIAYDSKERCKELVDVLLDLKSKWNGEDGLCATSKSNRYSNAGDSKTKETTGGPKLLSPIKKRCKGRPPCKRKQSRIEKVTSKKRKKDPSKHKRNTEKDKVDQVVATTGSSSQPCFGIQSNQRNFDLNDSLWDDEVLTL